jgi:hypothetical protein
VLRVYFGVRGLASTGRVSIEFPTWISLGDLSNPKVVDLVDAFPIGAMSFIVSARDEEICEADRDYVFQQGDENIFDVQRGD